MFSGGVGSWAAARRTVDAHGPDDVVLLFTDTLVEDPDLYRFLEQAAVEVGAPLVRIADGRTPFEVFHDRRFIGNSRTAHCSEELKQKPARRWLDEHHPDGATIVVGIDWTEIHRMRAVHASYSHLASGCRSTDCRSLFDSDGRRPGPTRCTALEQRHRVWAPLCDPPLVAKGQLVADLRATGIDVPAMYAEGFPHNNCGQQGCVRGGQDYWRHLLRMRPTVYLETERLEAKLRDELGTDSTVLTETVRGEQRRLPLATLRDRAESQPELFDGQDWGGCGCFVDEPAP